MPFVQEIFEMVADGHSIYEVAQHLRRKGTPSPGGAIGSWGRTPIRNIILSDTYLGTFWWGKENLAGRIKKLETKLDRVRDLFIDGNLPRPAYEEKKSLIRDEIDAVRTELAKVDDLDA